MNPFWQWFYRNRRKVLNFLFILIHGETKAAAKMRFKLKYRQMKAEELDLLDQFLKRRETKGKGDPTATATFFKSHPDMKKVIERRLKNLK